jgi:signal transduction histidine kinase
MASKCFMCGAAITRGILCERCDKPRKAKPQAARADEAAPAADLGNDTLTAAPRAEEPSGDASMPADIQPAEPVELAVAAAPSHPPPAAVLPLPPSPAPPASPATHASAPDAGSGRRSGGSAATAAAHAHDVEPFPKAPLLPFPVESTSPAITSVANVIVAAGAAAIVLGPDRGVKFVTDEAKKLFGATQAELSSTRQIETVSGLRIGDLSVPASTALRVRNRNILFTLVPLSGGAMGAVLMFREAEAMDAVHASFVSFVRETVFSPLRSLRESVLASARARENDPVIEDWASTIDQILSSLEMAPEVEEPPPAARLPRVVDIIHSVANRFGPFADLKNIQLQVDVPELDERFRNHEQLVDVLGVLMDNSLHYVSPGGQVVVGVRWMEHKGKPLLLFFVMDNGPMVPEPLRQSIFDPGFLWNPQAQERTGRGLSKVREFAVAHAGSVWVESKSGKACTFFLRVRPDGAR